MSARLALLAALVVAGCDGSTRVGLTLHCASLTADQRQSVNRLTVQAVVPPAMKTYVKTVDITSPLAETERIVLTLPDNSPEVAITVLALAGSAPIADGKAALVALEAGRLTSVEVVLGPEAPQDMGGDASMVASGFMVATNIALPFAPTQVVVGDADGSPGDELFASTGSDTMVSVLIHAAAPAYFGSTPLGRSTVNVTSKVLALARLRTSVSHKDLIVAGPTVPQGTNPAVAVFDGLSGAALVPATNLAGVTNAYSAAGGILDGVTAMGVPLVTVAGGPGVVFLAYNGSAAFTSTFTAPTIDARGSALTQLDNGRGEVVLADESSGAGKLRVCAQWDPAAPSCSATPMPVSGALTDVVAVDWDQDGTIDLVAIDPNAMHFIHNNGGTPAGLAETGQAVQLAGGRSPVIADLNGDGVPDVAYIDAAGANVVFQFRDKTKTTSTATLFVSGGPALLFLRAADLNGDGRAQLVAVDSAGGVFAIVRP